MTQTISSARRRSSRAAQITPAGFQGDFPVIDGVRVLGVLTRGDVLGGLARRSTNLSVQQAMRGEVETARPSEALDGALTRMHQDEYRDTSGIDAWETDGGA
jgi:CBS domain-containing protein